MVDYTIEEIVFTYAPRYVDLVALDLNREARLPAAVMEILYDLGAIPATARLRSTQSDGWAWCPVYTLSALRPVTDAPARIDETPWTS